MNTVVEVVRTDGNDDDTGETRYLVQAVGDTLDQYLLESQLDELPVTPAVDPKTEIDGFKFEVGKIYNMESDWSDYSTKVLVSDFGEPVEGNPVLIGMRVDSDGDIMPIENKTSTIHFENFTEITGDARGNFLHALVKKYVKDGDYIVAEAAWNTCSNINGEVVKVESTSADYHGVFPEIYGTYIKDGELEDTRINGIKNFRPATAEEIAGFEAVADPKLTAPDGSDIKVGSMFKTTDLFQSENYLVLITGVDVDAETFDMKKISLSDMEQSTSNFVMVNSAYHNSLKPVSDAEKAVIEKVLMG